MFRRTHLGAVLSAAVAAGLALTSAASSDAAAPPRQAGAATTHHAAASSAEPLVHDAATTARERSRIREYWTKARMRTALDGDLLAPRVSPAEAAASAPLAVGTPRAYGARKPRPAAAGVPYLGGPWNGGGQVVDSTGKVFFTLGGANYVCSANVVTSASRDLVTTAGHCLNEGPGTFATNFAFVPAYDNGARPYGTFTARQLTTTSQWGNSGDFNYDVGMAALNTVDGQHVADVVGTQGIAFNQPRSQFLYAFGYPAAAPYDGEELDYCSDDATNDVFGGSNDIRLDCNLTGGSSGGPWLAGFSEAAGTGTQVSVNSFGYRGEKNAMYGPYFGSVIQSLYSTASSL